MKQMDSIGIKICAYQAKLFEASISEAGCSSKIFIRRFMNSDLAKRLDDATILFESLTVHDAIEEIELQYGGSSYGKEKFSVEEMHWIGYIYRYWSYISGKPSKQLYKLIKPEKLRMLYVPYHTLDPLNAINRIVEEIGADNTDSSDIAKGVEVLRKIRKLSSTRLPAHIRF